MSKVTDYIAKMEKVTIKAQEFALLQIIKENEHLLLDIITGQLLNGKDGNGEFLQAYRSKDYAEMKLHLNPKGVTDLRLTGDFWDGFYAVVKKFPIIIDSKDEKRDHLVDKYGEAIFWPSTEGKSFFLEIIEASVREYYRGVYSAN
jgi:hypothetical protein